MIASADVPKAAGSARALLPKTAPIIALQNGMGHERVLRRAFGRERVVIGSCYAAAQAQGPSSVIHHGGRRFLLAVNARNRTAVSAAVALLSRGGWRPKVTRDEAGMLWTKLVYNAAVNLLGGAANATNGELVTNPDLYQLLKIRLRAPTERLARLGGIGE